MSPTFRLRAGRPFGGQPPVRMRNGGQHIQYNLLDAGTLRKAKEHPEEYKDLIVRVAGYSAYFVLLAPEVQDEIIARTEHELN